MQLGLSLGYWGAQPPKDLVSGVQEAERLGYEAVWTAECWGSDAFSPLVSLAAHTDSIRLGTGIVRYRAWSGRNFLPVRTASCLSHEPVEGSPPQG